MTEYRQHEHSYSKVSTLLLLFFCNTQSLRPAGYPSSPGPDYFGPPSGWLCSLSTFFVPVWFSTLGTVGLSTPAIILLWFYAESFVIATVWTMPIIIAVLHVWVIRPIAVVCWVSAPEASLCLCSDFASWSQTCCPTATGVCLMSSCFKWYLCHLCHSHLRWPPSVFFTVAFNDHTMCPGTPILHLDHYYRSPRK